MRGRDRLRNKAPHGARGEKVSIAPQTTDPREWGGAVREGYFNPASAHASAYLAVQMSLIL